MSTLQLTKTQMKQGVWQGIITGMGEDKPQIEVTHEDRPVPDIILTHNQSADHWTLSVPIPPKAIADILRPAPTMIAPDIAARQPGDTLSWPKTRRGAVVIENKATTPVKPSPAALQ